MPALAVPLSQAQIDAANRLHTRLEEWVLTDDALLALATRFPEWSLKASLLKVAAINQLYGTNLYAVNRMAEHVARIMAGAETSQVRPALVERIAALPPSPRQRKSRCHWSFASKLAHFFISTERFPIYDGYAVRMVAYHLGRRGVVRDTDHPYQAYVDNVERLRERSGLVWMGRELDRYLWLAGLYRVWKRKPTARINSEVRRFIEAAPRDRAAQADLAALGA